ncbi:MAG TPA: hypothetical protein VJ974_01650 [Geopsychrobacteraceae bacterium]|nr:hypothetical protein [Geopsychrobacteraceae bacterium]
MYADNHTDNHTALRKDVNDHLGLKTGEASKANFEKAKSELIAKKTAISKAISLLSMDKYLEIVGQKSQSAAPVVLSAVAMVDSYFIPLPSETIDGAFARTKREAVAKLKSEAAQVKYFSFKDYGVKKKKSSAAKKIRATNFDNVRVERKRIS